MSETIQVKIKADLSPLNKGKTECAAELCYGDMEQPDSIQINIGKLSAEQMNGLSSAGLADVFGNIKIDGSIDETRSFDAEVNFIKGIQFGFGDAVLECRMSNFIEHDKTNAKECRTWKFRLANLRLDRGDEYTLVPPPFETIPKEKIEEYQELIAAYHNAFSDKPLDVVEVKKKYTEFKIEGGGRVLNRIRFKFAGRNWLLDDDLTSRWPKDTNTISEPIVSGTLMADKLADDSLDDILKTVTDITCLLSFALGRDIAWVSAGCFDEDGHCASKQFRKPGVMPFNRGGSAIADNWELGNLKNFLEVADAVIQADTAWWHQSLGIFMQTKGSKQVMVKCALLNILLDRISYRVSGDSFGDEIDSKLNERIDQQQFRQSLHTLLSTLSENWEQSRTNVLCNDVIKQWNAKPSFPQQVLRACKHLGIPKLSGKKIRIRHQLMHEGEFDRKLNFDQKVEYLFDIEAVVGLMMVRMLNFDGFIYLQTMPPHHKPVSDFLATKED